MSLSLSLSLVGSDFDFHSAVSPAKGGGGLDGTWKLILRHEDSGRALFFRRVLLSTLLTESGYNSSVFQSNLMQSFLRDEFSHVCQLLETFFC